jgi:hypothetical protein
VTIGFLSIFGFLQNDGLNQIILEVVSKPQIRLKSKAHADEKAQHTCQYVSILKRLATQLLGLRWDFETTSRKIQCILQEYGE